MAAHFILMKSQGVWLQLMMAVSLLLAGHLFLPTTKRFPMAGKGKQISDTLSGQLAGQKIEGGSGLFSLGASLYQLACGKLPFEGDAQAQLLCRIANASHHTECRDGSATRSGGYH